MSNKRVRTSSNRKAMGALKQAPIMRPTAANVRRAA